MTFLHNLHVLVYSITGEYIYSRLIPGQDFLFALKTTAWKVSKYEPEKTLYLDNFHAVDKTLKKFAAHHITS